MDMLPEDNLSRTGIILGTGALSIMLLKSNEKQLSSNLSNNLSVLVLITCLYLSYQLNSDMDVSNDVESVTTESLTNQTVEPFYQGETEAPVEEEPEEVPVVEEPEEEDEQ